jgi:hypothetical protein
MFAHVSPNKVSRLEVADQGPSSFTQGSEDVRRHFEKYSKRRLWNTGAPCGCTTRRSLPFVPASGASLIRLVLIQMHKIVQLCHQNPAAKSVFMGRGKTEGNQSEIVMNRRHVEDSQLRRVPAARGWSHPAKPTYRAASVSDVRGTITSNVWTCKLPADCCRKARSRSSCFSRVPHIEGCNEAGWKRKKKTLSPHVRVSAQSHPPAHFPARFSQPITLTCLLQKPLLHPFQIS